ncbi:hypothetical protein TNCV_1644611 [Trichonephila clavipes]|nr:hypothetical protein TNCV_1644611 [Trichonephila clavipes]
MHQRLQLVVQVRPTYALSDSSQVRMLAIPYGCYPQIKGIRLRCLFGQSLATLSCREWNTSDRPCEHINQSVPNVCAWFALKLS